MQPWRSQGLFEPPSKVVTPQRIHSDALVLVKVKHEMTVCKAYQGLQTICSMGNFCTLSLRQLHRLQASHAATAITEL